jgi:hypothetical protein
MIAMQVLIIWGANLIPSGAACGGDDPRRKPACSRMPAKLHEGSDGGALATPGRGRWELQRRSAAAVRFENSKRKARDGFLRAGFAVFAMVALCP